MKKESSLSNRRIPFSLTFRISQHQERDHFPGKLLSIESRITDDMDDMEENYNYCT